MSCCFRGFGDLKSGATVPETSEPSTVSPFGESSASSPPRAASVGVKIVAGVALIGILVLSVAAIHKFNVGSNAYIPRR